MYNESRHFALEDAAHRMADTALSNLKKFYGESLLSSKAVIRERVARHHINLVKAEHELQQPTLKRLQSSFSTSKHLYHSWKCIVELLDEDLLASLDS